MARFAILGAGLSGLAVGNALVRGGHEVVCLEREPEVGGLARSVRTGGFTFDYGPHFLFGDKVLPLLARLTPGLELAPVRRDLERMLVGGRYFKFPFQPKDLLLHMPRRALPGVLLEMLGRRLAPARDGGASVEEWVSEAVGRRLYDYISLSGYIEKLYGLPASRVSREWGIQKLKFLARWREAGLLTLASRAWGEGRRVQAYPVSYPPAGIDQLAGALAEGLTGAGGRVVRGAEVCQVDSDKPAVSFRQDGDLQTLDADFVVSTLPVTALVKLLSPAAPEAVAAACRGSLRYRSVALLFIRLEEPEAIPHLCIYFTQQGPSFRRLTEFRRLSPRLAPEGRTSLCVEITFAEGDGLSALSDRELFELAAGQLSGLGMLRRPKVSGYQVLRLPFAYPVYELGYEAGLEAVLGWLGGLASLVSVGRQGLFHYNTMANSVLEGYGVGERLAAALPGQRGEIIRSVYAGRMNKYGAGGAA